MGMLVKLQSSIAALIVTALWATPASADICFLGVCFPTGGGGGGSTAAPEIDGAAGIAVMALLAGVGAIIYRKIKD